MKLSREELEKLKEIDNIYKKSRSCWDLLDYITRFPGMHDPGIKDDLKLKSMKILLGKYDKMRIIHEKMKAAGNKTDPIFEKFKDLPKDHENRGYLDMIKRMEKKVMSFKPQLDNHFEKRKREVR